MPNIIGPVLAGPTIVTRMLAEALLKDVDPSKAARFATPGGVKVVSNHPVFVYGHLSLYNRRVMAMCNLPEGPTAVPAEWEALFKAGVECKDDESGTLYPSFAAVSKKFLEGFDAAVAAVKATDDSVLLQPNPTEGRSREMFPLRAHVIGFNFGPHPASHLGQASAWRRMMGLGSAM
jgi:hypothetical protein